MPSTPARKPATAWWRSPPGYRPAEAVVQVAVEDNGSGIEPDEIKRIFTVFESRKGARGTGLGLPVSQKIVREHGGDILVESTPGKGSRFVIEIPAVIPDSPGAEKEAVQRTRSY